MAEPTTRERSHQIRVARHPQELRKLGSERDSPRTVRKPWAPKRRDREDVESFPLEQQRDQLTDRAARGVADDFEGHRRVEVRAYEFYQCIGAVQKGFMDLGSQTLVELFADACAKQVVLQIDKIILGEKQPDNGPFWSTRGRVELLRHQRKRDVESGHLPRGKKQSCPQHALQCGLFAVQCLALILESQDVMERQSWSDRAHA
mmetsp:Transcript_20867/g.51419  ORF Transcript_20867/g.51419 Transcript_20867/m.51419 type:complete len:204 (+) Transcript_20867:1793-2404(+)